MKLEVIFEDNHLLVVNKPAGLLTQPSGTDRDNLQDQAKAWIKEKYQKPGNVFLESVHRLDKPVRGIVLFAKTSKALSRLNESMREKKSQKIYHATVEGTLPVQEGVLEDYIIHDDFHAEVVGKSHPQAKLARLRFRVLEKKDGNSLVEIELETGRYHQIRLQFSHAGCPIVGDQKYGSTISLPEGRISLHHIRLSIPHPISHEMMTLTADN